MQYLYYAVFAYAYLMFLGFGAGLFVLPQRLQKYGPLLFPFIGYAWAMWVTWQAYQADLPGTNAYGAYVLIAAAAINALAWVYRRDRIQMWAGKEIAMAAVPALAGFLLMTIPFVVSPHGATTMALGNNDIADYAGMARFIQEFPRTSQEGFVGQFANFRKLSDEIWFGPAAITSLFSSALGSETYRLQSLCITLFFILGSSLVYIFARELFNTENWSAAAIVLLSAIHPVLVRVVYDGFHGQIVATAMMPGFLAAAILCAREHGWRAKVAYLPLLVAFCWAFMISYSFMLIFGLWVAAAFIVLKAWSDSQLKQGLHSGIVLALAIAICFLISPMRGVMLYKQLGLATSQGGYYFGFLSPDRVLGFLGNDLFLTNAHSTGNEFIGFAIVLAVGIGCWAAWRRGYRELAALWVPLLVVYAFSAYLYFRADQSSLAFASYKAFKPIAVFLPIYLTATVLAINYIAQAVGRWQRISFTAIVTAIAVAEFYTTQQLVQRMHATRGVVTREMAQLLEVDHDERVKSINIYSSELWSYLWHTYFLMHKSLYLQTSAYARPQSLPAGDFDLIDLTDPSGNENGHYLSIQRLNARYQLGQLRQPERALVQFGPGWWGKEPTHRWAGATGKKYSIFAIADHNGLAQLKGLLLIPLRKNDQITLAVNGKMVPLSQSGTQFTSDAFTLVAGRNTLEFTHAADPLPPSDLDPRALLAAWKEIVVDFVQAPIEPR